MNSRIKELAKKAGWKDTPTVRGAFTSFNKEKFAELIVKECMKIAHAAAAAGDPIKESIAEHFGVK